MRAVSARAQRARATQQSMRRVRRVRRARARCSSVLGERAGWRETRRGNRATGWAGGHARARVARRAPATFGCGLRESCDELAKHNFRNLISSFRILRAHQAIYEARFSAHASSSEKRYWTRTVGRFSIPESLARAPIRPRMNALGRAGRSRSRHFTAKRLSKTKFGLHKESQTTKHI